MTIEYYSDRSGLQSLVGRCLHVTFRCNPFREPLLLAGVFCPTDGYGLFEEQFIAIRRVSTTLAFIVAEVEHADLGEARAWICRDTSFEDFAEHPMSLAVNVAYIHVDGEWAVLISEDSWAWVGISKARIRDFYDAYPRLDDDLLAIEKLGDWVLPRDQLCPMLAAIRSLRDAEMLRE